MRELVTMYRGWAERRGYEGQAAAEGDEPLRAVLHLHGPGVFGFLSGERGTHRRIDDDARLLAYVRLYRPSRGEVVVPETLKLDGTVWCWGHNSYGQLGDNTTTTRTTDLVLNYAP